MKMSRFPDPMAALNALTIRSMVWLNGFAHLIIGLALAVTVLMFTWLFFDDVYEALRSHNLVHGFLHALGTLMVLWIVSALITSEIRYLRGGKLEVTTFIEVAMVVVLRRFIVMPVQEVVPSIKEVALWIGAAVLLGLMYLLVRWGQRMSGPEEVMPVAGDE
ncbi:MAG: phosphate-starvation-inducible PsiE family protein [Pseudomonadota bacterium]|uniref:phosphate-starvation-inducible PsiE family protein n=2 Tax=Thermithiobacillus tepidarius TaxID=929 RepID=UPI00040717F7